MAAVEYNKWNQELLGFGIGELVKAWCCLPCVVGGAIAKKEDSSCLIPCLVTSCTSGLAGIYYRMQIREEKKIGIGVGETVRKRTNWVFLSIFLSCVFLILDIVDFVALLSFHNPG
eukprot:807361_1